MQVIVAEGMADAVRERIEGLNIPVELLVVSRDGHTQVHLDQATAFFRERVTRAGYERVLAAAPKLRWVHTASAGVDGLINDMVRQRNITLTNSAGVYAAPIAEWVLLALLMIVKRAPEMFAAQQAQRWANQGDYDELTGKTLTILGAGGIGAEIAQRAAVFGLRVWAINRSGAAVPHTERVVSGEHWRVVLPETDFLVLAAPLTSATYHIIGASELKALPQHAWLINIARGALVDEPALIAALQSGRLGGAALDTFEQEPLPGDSPLWTMPNVIISPHHSGSSPRSAERVLELFIDNLQCFVHSQPLRNIVNIDVEY